jgi:hypothetical protein
MLVVFWDIALCSLVDPYQCFRGAYCLLHQAVSSSETSVNIYQTAWHYISEDGLILITMRTSNLTVQHTI